jgi:hypothetical protein
MTDKEIASMARNAGLPEPFVKSEQVKRFAALVAEAERKACAEMALEALEYYRSGEDYQPTPASDAITKLRAALASQTVPSDCLDSHQPVAWSYEISTTTTEHGYDGWEHRITKYKPTVPEGAIRSLTPLYTAPPQRKPLTDEEIDKCWYQSGGFTKNTGFARAIERAHGIGGE